VWRDGKSQGGIQESEQVGDVLRKMKGGQDAMRVHAKHLTWAQGILKASRQKKHVKISG
jgi:hypothetical protein